MRWQGTKLNRLQLRRQSPDYLVLINSWSHVSPHSRNRWKFQHMGECNLVTFEDYWLAMHRAQKQLSIIHCNVVQCFHEKSWKAEHNAVFIPSCKSSKKNVCILLYSFFVHDRSVWIYLRDTNLCNSELKQTTNGLESTLGSSLNGLHLWARCWADSCPTQSL